MARWGKGYLGYALIAAAVWVGWEAIKLPVSERAPPAVAMRLSPSSPNVLARAAEGELQADRNSNAEALAAESLAKAPFNVRALRVLGLVHARTGREGSADSLLTLAGNWSLRDDPTHAWLVAQRLRQGSYSSAFAHADTLARRRPDTAEPIFDLFATAAVTDPRALAPLAQSMSEAPPWRQPFLTYLIEREDTDSVLLALGVMLESSAKPFTDGELRQVYQNWFAERRMSALHLLRDRTGRPAAGSLQNGDFQVPEDRQILPFGWRLTSGIGWSTGVIEDDLDRSNFALRAEYNGRSAGLLAEQPMFLAPGRHLLQGRQRVELAREGAGLGWRVVCLESGETIAEADSGIVETGDWHPFKVDFVVPERDCSVQLLILVTYPGARRQSHVAVWYDDFTLRPAAAGS